jgi:hypothetical protein
MNIVDRVLFQCRLHPATAAMCAPGGGIGLISYGRLGIFIRNISRSAVAAGLTVKDVVAIHVEDPIFHATIALALGHLGVATCSIAADGAIAALAANAIVTDRRRTYPHGGRVIVADRTWTEGDAAPARPAETAASGLCRIVLSPAGGHLAVALDHRLLLGRIGHAHAIFSRRFSACSRVLCDFGLEAAAGFQMLVDVLSRGGMFVFAGDSLEAAIDITSRYEIRAWIASTDRLVAFAESCDNLGTRPNHLELAIGFGRGLAGAQASQVRKLIALNTVCAFGYDETGTIAVAPAGTVLQVAGAVGYVVPDVTVETAAAGHVPARGVEGPLRIRSAHQIIGYRGQLDGAAAAAGFHDGWFFPGEMGSVTTDGTLVISSQP